AYADVAGKPQGWAEAVMRTWNRVLGEHDEAENELEQPLLDIFSAFLPEGVSQQPLTHNNHQGKLFVTTASRLLAMLQGLGRRDLVLPKNAAGLSRRLRSGKLNSLAVLDDDNAPELPALRRTGV